MSTFADYLTRLGSDSPTPGGGSAAALVGATGAALVSMVARIVKNGDLAGRADALRVELLAAQGRDEAAYEAVIAAHALPKADDAERARRGAALQLALTAAAAEPLRAAALCLDVIELAAEAAAHAKPGLISDAGCAAEFAAAAVAACGYNVRVNLRYMHDADAVANAEVSLRACEREAAARLVEVRRLAGRP